MQSSSTHFALDDQRSNVVTQALLYYHKGERRLAFNESQQIWLTSIAAVILARLNAQVIS